MRKSNKRILLPLLAGIMSASVFGGVFMAFEKASAEATEIMPIAKYEFKDENDLGKDSMGNYHMEYRNAYVAGATGDLLNQATLIDGGGVTFDGNFCVAQDAESNMFADVTSFTLCFEIKTGEHNKDWQHYLGVGNSTDEFAFIGADSASSNLYKFRLQAKGINGTAWNSEPIFGDGKEITEFQKVIVSVQTGGTLQIWLNGNALTLTKGNTVCFCNRKALQ